MAEEVRKDNVILGGDLNLTLKEREIWGEGVRLNPLTIKC